jgi:predicted nucleic acid-binding protein
MTYADTSVIIKLYVREERSREAADWLKKRNEAIPLTFFHELEFTNALKLKQFRNELSAEDAEYIFKKIGEHEKRGVYYRPAINWTDVFSRSLGLSKAHTPGIGSRSLDIIHVALALSIGAERIVTFDDRQSKLASAAGLHVEM